MGRFGFSQHGGAAFTALLGLCAVSLAWSQTARPTQVQGVTLPGGGVAQIMYVGNVPPRIVVMPALANPARTSAIMPARPLTGIGRLMAQMDAQLDGMMQRAAWLAAQPMPMPAPGDMALRVQRAVPTSALYTPAD